MKYIDLTRGLQAIIDDQDYDRVSALKWCAVECYIGAFYAATHRGKARVYMHRFVLGVGDGGEVDHINRNKLDNRKENLRLVTRSQNIMNYPRRKDNTSGHKGVHYDKATGKWMAYISVNSRHKALGRFLTFGEAVAARLHAIEELYGQYAGPQ